MPIIDEVRYYENGNRKKLCYRETFIYTKVEADRLGVSYKHWRDKSVKKGELVLTDDDYVVEVTGVKYQKGGNLVKTVRQTRYADKGFKNSMTIDEPLCRGELNDDKYSYYSKRTELTGQEEMFVLRVLTHFNPKQAAGEVYNNYTNNNLTARRLMSKKKIQEAIVNGGTDLMKELGLTKEGMLAKLKEYIDGDGKDSFAAWKEASQLINLKGQVRNDMMGEHVEMTEELHQDQLFLKEVEKTGTNN